MKNIFLVVFLQFIFVVNAQKTGIKNKPTANSEIKIEQWNEPTVIELFGSEPPAANPKLPNGGTQIGSETELSGNFSFNKKVGFSVNSPEENFVSYFYLNTKNGNSMMDWKGLKEVITENAEGEMTQIKTANNDFYQYIKSSEGNFAMKMGSGQSMVVHDIQTEMLSKQFFKSFKKTGNKVGKIGGNKFPRVEYTGIFEGKKMSIWLSYPQEILIDTKFTYSISGYWGLGFIASPTGKTYMITGIEGDGVSIFMNYIENTSTNFSGKGYKPMGEMMGQAMAQNGVEMNSSIKQMHAEANAEKDPKLKQLKLQQIKQTEKLMQNTKSNAAAFSQTSDLQDAPFIKDASSEDATGNYYNMMLTSLEQSIIEHQLGLKEAQQNNDVKSGKRYTCLINCTSNEKNRLEKVKAQHLKILSQYKNEDENRDAKINQLMETQGQPKPCNCD